MYSDGEQVLTPPAIETWRDTLNAMSIMQTASSPEGFLFEIVSGNLCLVILVTGFEAYCKSRFLELEDEGITPDYEALVRRFTSERERQNGDPEIWLADAQDTGVSPTRFFVQSRKIDFQNYQQCNRAYSKTFGITFGTTLGIQNTSTDFIQQVIGYRHRIVHVSPTEGILNPTEAHSSNPVFATNEFVSRAMTVFDDFVQALHSATLRLGAGG